MNLSADGIYKIKSRLLAYSPNLKESWMLLAYIYIGLMILSIIIALIMRIVGITKPEAWRVLFSALQFAIAAVVIVNRLGKNSSYVPISSPRQSSLLWLLFVLFTLSVDVAAEPLTMWIKAWISMPDIVKKIYAEYSQINLPVFLVVAVIYPIRDEWLYRGIILKGLLSHYPPVNAIVWSAVIYTVIHLSPWWALQQFCFALAIGWIYWQTRSLWCCISLQAACNIGGIFIAYFTQVIPGETKYADLAGGYYIYPVALLVCALAIIGIKKVVVPYDVTSESRG